jgi:hypothetical protein
MRPAVLTDERPVGGNRKEMRVDELRKHRVTGRVVQAPQPPRLLHGQSQARHFDEFSTDAPYEILIASAEVFHSCPRFVL